MNGEPGSETGTPTPESRSPEAEALSQAAEAMMAMVDVQKQTALKLEEMGSMTVATDKISSAALFEYIPPAVLEQKGYVFTPPDGQVRGADYRKPKEFGDGKPGYERWALATYEGLRDYDQLVDETVRVKMKAEIVRATDISQVEKRELVTIVDGLYHVHDYRLALYGSNGDIKLFARTTGEGGIISEDEGDRLSFQHLQDQCRLFPAMARALSRLDEWAASQPPDGEYAPQDFLDNLTPDILGMPNMPEWQFQQQKDLALAWFRLTGLEDVRQFQAKHAQYEAKMPSEKQLKTSAGQKAYREAIAFKRWSGDYDSPYGFLMDPLTLVGDVLKTYEPMVAKIRAGVREFDSDHSILTLGWRPVAWNLLDNIYKDQQGVNTATHPLNPSTVAGISLRSMFNGKDLSQLTSPEWDKLRKGANWQKENIKNASKASGAQEALMGIFSLDAKDVFSIYGKIMSYLRTNEPEAGIWRRGEILPLITHAIQEMLHDFRRAKVQFRVTKSQMREQLLAIAAKAGEDIEDDKRQRIAVGPTQEKFYLENCTVSDTTAVTIQSALSK